GRARGRRMTRDLTTDDVDRLAVLRGTEWRRLLASARRKVERTGTLDGSVSIHDPSDAERHLVTGMTGSYRATRSRTIRVSLVEVDDDVRDRCGIGLLAALAHLNGPVRNRPAERAEEE